MPETRIKTAMATCMNGSRETATISQMGWKVMNREAVVEAVVVGMEVAAELLEVEAEVVVVVVVADAEGEEADVEAEDMEVGAEDVEVGAEDVGVVD